ncbi:MAG TPA: DUF885 domain-containing protein [Chthoniobacterales bacterium]
MTKATSSTSSSKPSAAPRAFRRLADAFLAESHVRFPEDASALGLAKYDAGLSTNSAADFRAQNALVARTLAAVEALPEAEFTGDDYLDRRGFLAMLRTSAFYEDRLERWRTNPQRPVDGATHAIFDLVIRHAHSPAALRRALPAIESRLEKIPAYLATGARNLRRPVPLWTKLALASAEGGIEFLTGLEAELGALSANPDRNARLITAAKQAFADYAAAIRKKPPGPKDGYAVGREGFEFLMRERLGFDQSLPEIRANGLALIERFKGELRAEAARLGLKDPAAALAAASAAWTPDRPLIDLYRDTTAQIRARLGELDLVTLPTGESLDVLPVPAFLRHQFPTAAYNQPPAYSRRQVGIFWVNDLSLTQTDPARKLAEIRQHHGIELTAAHEAYPGHHLQFAIQNQHPSKLRRLFAHSIYYEGWTLWCEKMCVDRGIVDLAAHPLTRLQELQDALWRAYRIIIDCGLHDGSLSYDGACKVLMDGVGFTKARAQGDVNWYTSSPTVPMSYLLGRLEVERLHAHFVEGEGWSLKQFNDWMLSHGAIPWRWILEARMRPSG